VTGFLTEYQLRRWTAHAFWLTLVGAPACGAQTVRFGDVSDSVRSVLGASWRDDSTQSERAYCVRRARIVARVISPTKVDSIYDILEVRPAHVVAASPNHVEFECAQGTPELHTHTPATCYADDPQWCTKGGPDAYSCQPSRADYEKLVDRGDPFAIIQCDRVAFRFYYPSDYVAPARARPPGSGRRESGRRPSPQPVSPRRLR
jgi:hypothetical protein